jgi:hypothetical protein
MSKAINVIKDSFLWQVDFVEGHPWLSIGAIWVLAVLAIAF